MKMRRKITCVAALQSFLAICLTTTPGTAFQIFSPACSKSRCRSFLHTTTQQRSSRPSDDEENIDESVSFEEGWIPVDFDYENYGPYRSPPLNTSKRKQRIANSRSSRQRRKRSTYPSFDEIGDTSQSRSVRRQRRQRRAQRETPRLSSILRKSSQKVVDIIPEEVAAVGSKAARLAARQGKQVWNDIVELVDAVDEDLEPRRSMPRRKRRSRKTPVSRSYEQPEVYFEGDSVDIAEEAHTSISQPTDTKQSLDSERTQRPIKEILDALDDRDIAYGFDATRQELEGMLEEAIQADEKSLTADLKETSVSETVTSSNPVDETTRRDDRTTSSPNFSSAQEKIRRKVSNIGSQVKSSTKKRMSSAFQHFEESSSKDQGRKYRNGNGKPQTIIVDAVVEDFSRNDDDFVIDVLPQPTRPKRELRKRQRRPNMARKHGRRETERHPDFKSRKTHNHPSMNTRNDAFDPSHASGGRLLPPSQLSPSNRRRRERGKRVQTDKNRRIYSPRSGVYQEQTPLDRDSLDQLGDLFANSVDAFLWGDDEISSNSSATDEETKTRSRRQSGHWKDRMEEQFDTMMGIGKDGKHYNRWIKDEIEAEANAEGTDALSFARGRSPRKGSRRRIHDMPVWEEPDSILSLLFGTGSSRSVRNSDAYRSSSFMRSGSLVKLLYGLSRSATSMVGMVCRWASVRGSIPQPLVVVGVLSAGLSSSPKSRIRNIVLILLALRTAGELLHGYVYDDKDFWEHDGSDASDSESSN